MKKKKTITLIAACMALFAGTQTSWAQSGVLLPENQVDARRGDTDSKPIGYVRDSTNVNNEFGAGESASIDNNLLTRPGIDGSLNNGWSALSTLRIGSDVSDNIVVNTYNFGGYATEFLFFTANNKVPTSWNSLPFDPNGTFSSTNNINIPNNDDLPFINNPFSGMSTSWNGSANTDVTANLSESDMSELNALIGLFAAGSETKSIEKDSYNKMLINIYVVNHVPKNLHGWRINAIKGKNPYTSTETINDIYDDNTPLIQVDGHKLDTKATQTVVYAPDEDHNSAKFTPYDRPTTVSVGGLGNKFDNIYINNLNWRYRTHNLKKWDGTNATDPNPASDAWNDYIKTGPDVPYPELKGTCGHLKPDIDEDHKISPTVSISSISNEWKTDDVTAKTLLDGAVQLLNGAEVCVKFDIEDRTTTAGSVGGNTTTGVTDAMLVFPETGNVALRVGRNFNRMPIWHEGTNANLLYKAASFPQAESDSLYLYKNGTNNFSYAGAGSLLTYYNEGAVNVVVDNLTNGRKTRGGSILGVKGNYDSNNLPVTTGTDNDGVIEVGENTTGQQLFNIHSGGIIKNYEDCGGSECFPISFSSGNVPKFNINGSKTLFILNDGNCCEASILVKDATAANEIASAFVSGEGNGDMHIQANGKVSFAGLFAPSVKKDNELHIFSDLSYIEFLGGLQYGNTKDVDGGSDLYIWAKGNDKRKYSCVPDVVDDCSGVVLFGDGATSSIEHDGKGLTLVRSEKDDILLKNGFTYTNSTSSIDNGEFIMQAGQDIYGSAEQPNTIEIKQAGYKNILLEAQNTIHIKQKLFYDRSGATSGNIIIKAGYPTFSSYANTYDPGTDWKKANRVDDFYPADGCESLASADIWFGGEVDINNSAVVPANTISTTIRAWNSVLIDKKFDYSTVTGTAATTGNFLIFAEIGNVEAIKGGTGNPVTFNMGTSANGDPTELRIQAGNKVWQNDAICAKSDYYEDNSFDGNILFNSPLVINNYTDGPTIISSARDIENQTNGQFDFNYKNDDHHKAPFLMTAGRHIETHKDVNFNYEVAGIGTSANITMQAGRLNRNTDGCSDALCKRVEYGSNLVGPSLADNVFSKGGDGNGSILLFAPLNYIYQGTGNILMTALNGNIESDPYLHGNYKRQNGATTDAAIHINHNLSSGTTTLEAIDIKLHDIIDYDATAGAATGDNGRFYVHAFDSILTRNVKYTNSVDNGNAEITTDKYKNLVSGGCSSSIHQGHIVLGYGADCENKNFNDSIIFNLRGNKNTTGANVLIKAGYEGFKSNTINGKANASLFSDAADQGKGFGGNITFDFMKIDMGKGNRNVGGYTEISTPNGNIWGKDSLQYHGINGNLLVDAGLGSKEDETYAKREEMLNTEVDYNCDGDKMWRTGNIMMKGGSLNFNDVIDNDGTEAGTGNATFRTREGFIDTYDAFTVDSMRGDLLKYAGTLNASSAANEWGDISERDFAYNPIKNSGSVFFGADDNIMMNYGYSNGKEPAYHFGALSNGYDVKSGLVKSNNPFYQTSYKNAIDGCYSTFNVNTNGYLWYKKYNWPRAYHRLYRGCAAPISSQASTCSPLTGICQTIPNGARDLYFDFEKDANGTDIASGGVGIVAGDYIDMFTKFTYKGGSGKGMGAVPSMTTLNGEYVQGYGLYIKSLWSGSNPEKRRVSCFGCDTGNGGREMTYVGFHDDARIHAENQKALISAPVVEFFGHAELDAQSNRGSKTDLVVKGDSLIFHDSAIFDGTLLRLETFTTDASARGDMRYGVVNDSHGTKNYKEQGPAITMGDRMVPVLELGYQRCNEPSMGVTPSPNINSKAGKEDTPLVGGDIVVTCKNAFALPIFNTVVANHARISFIASIKDGDANGGEYVNACVRTDLLRIRNKVEFYTDPADDKVRMGTLKMTTVEAMPSLDQAGIFPRHIHMEPGSELSLPGEDMLFLDRTTTVGGYGNIHENVFVKQDGIIAPGYASLMEIDCASGSYQGKLTVHNLKMEKDATMRISIGSNNKCYGENGEVYSCTQTDTLHVQDTIFFNEKVPLRVLQEDDDVEPGCYLFLIYDDTLGLSKERVKNLVLEEKQNKNTGYYYSLDFTEIGKVYLCVSTSPVPPVQRYVDLHVIDGVKTNPSGKYYVTQKQNVSFTATYADGQERQVKATGYYSQNTIVLPGTKQVDGSYLYTIYNVVEPWDVYFDGYVANEGIEGTGVWTYKNTLHINVDKEDIVSIYNMTGVLYRKIEVPAGNSKFTLDKGMYIVTLKDGSVHKIVIK